MLPKVQLAGRDCTADMQLPLQLPVQLPLRLLRAAGQPCQGLHQAALCLKLALLAMLRLLPGVLLLQAVQLQVGLGGAGPQAMLLLCWLHPPHPPPLPLHCSMCSITSRNCSSSTKGQSSSSSRLQKCLFLEA